MKLLTSLPTRLLAGAVVGTVLALSISSGTVLSLLTQATIYAVFALGVGLLLQQQAMPAELALLLTLLGLGLVAFLIGLVIVRVPGVAFGMLTLAIGQVFYLSASRSRGLTGGADGMNIDWPARLFGVELSLLLQPKGLFLLSWGVLLLVMAGLTLLLRTRFGAITEAVRDNEERARFIGIRTLVPRAAIYALSAMVTGLAGLLAALNTGFVSPENLHWSLSGVALMMVVVGGYKALWGPALGAVVYFLAKDVLGDYANHWMAIFGIALITVIVFAPTGLAGALGQLLRPRAPKPARRPAPAAH